MTGPQCESIPELNSLTACVILVTTSKSKKKKKKAADQVIPGYSVEPDANLYMCC